MLVLNVIKKSVGQWNMIVQLKPPRIQFGVFD
jgi:hypothetical protein